MVFLIGVLQRLFFPSTLSFLFPPTTFHIGMILETTIISLGLVYQYYWLEKEQDRQREIAFSKELHEKELETMQRTMKSISGEIHDNVGQILSLAKLTINSIDHSNPKSSQEKLNTSSVLIKKAIHDLRNLASVLSSDGANNEGLIDLIKKELVDLKQAGKHETEFILEGEPYRLIHQLELFRIFQEALNNSIKHADASKISVRTSFKPDYFEMQISDNGIGFDMTAIKKNNHSGLGIRNIQNRAKMISGDVKIETGENSGTSILVRLTITESKRNEDHVPDLDKTI
jgi:signal transduction histidine kinase